MTLNTLNDVFFSVVESNRSQVMLYRRPIQWIPISTSEFYQNVIGVARAMCQWGIGPGDRVAILSENRPEWAIADFATLLIGAVVVPIYTTLTADQTVFLLNDSGARAVFVSNEPHLNKVLSIRERSRLERIAVMDDVETTHAYRMHQMMQNGSKERDREFEKAGRAVSSDDVATIIYTSGTTGTPKGVVLTHGNMASNINCSLGEFGVKPGDTSISFLPLSHVTARHVDFAMLYHGVTLAYVSHVEQLPQALLEIHPTIFVGVPRVYEKIHSQVEIKASGFPQRLVYRWALSVGRKYQAETVAGRVPTSLSWTLADRILYSKVRVAMGDRAQLYISGGAPLGRSLAEWYANIGIRIHEGYGLTETSPVIAVNTPKAHKLGTVGKPLSNVQVRIADDGEVLVRGASVFHGYWNRPEETRDAFINGWFKTGDIGNLDADGFLSITDRKKDLIKTSGGKFLAPQPIEGVLKHNALVAEAVVVGDKRKFPAVIICPYFSLLEDWARANHVAFTSRAELVANNKVQALYDGIVADLNQNLAQFEKLKKVMLVWEEFSTTDGTLTASMKLRRRAVEQKYAPEIENLYAQAELITKS
ncbi:MAG TPA: long-chain fatty acid--CoA ligase [Terriglobales bacterium]|jgi:long-chain acyl-CoA synthetase